MAKEGLDVHRMQRHQVDKLLVHTSTSFATTVAASWCVRVSCSMRYSISDNGEGVKGSRKQGRTRVSEKVTAAQIATVLREPCHILLARALRVLGQERCIKLLVTEALLVESTRAACASRMAAGSARSARVFLQLCRERTTPRGEAQDIPVACVSRGTLSSNTSFVNECVRLAGRSENQGNGNLRHSPLHCLALPRALRAASTSSKDSKPYRASKASPCRRRCSCLAWRLSATIRAL